MTSDAGRRIRLAKDKRSLRIAFDDGTAFDLPAEYLRITSPSAEVQGHSPAERRTVPGKRRSDDNRRGAGRRLRGRAPLR